MTRCYFNVEGRMSSSITHILDNPLHIADFPSWHDDPDYSSAARNYLGDALLAYGEFPRGSLKRQLALHYLLDGAQRLLSKRMMSLQLLNVRLLIALYHEELSTDSDAIDALEDAAELAFELEEFIAYAEILLHLGGVYRRSNRHRHASSNFAEGLDWIGRRPPHRLPNARPLSLHLLAARASAEFMLGDYAIASDIVTNGLRAAGSDPSAAPQRASFLWISALLHRWNGDPYTALREARAAADIVRNQGNACSLARIECVAADIIIDRLAAMRQFGTLEGSDNPAVLIRQAEDAARSAIHLAAISQDTNGEALGRVTLARLSGLTDRHGNPFPALEWAIHLAHSSDDVCLANQSYSVLGDVLLRNDDLERARNCYRNALAAAVDSIAAMGHWPRIGLRRTDDIQN